MKIRESSISSKIQKNLEIRVVIAGGDSALDWSIFFDRCRFRNMTPFVVLRLCRVQELKDAGKIRMITPAEVVGLNGAEHIESIDIEENGAHQIETDFFFFWSYAKLGPIGNWGLEIENAIKVNNSLDYQTISDFRYR
jgi:thioredoxin reductase (NADPH)